MTEFTGDRNMLQINNVYSCQYLEKKFKNRFKNLYKEIKNKKKKVGNLIVLPFLIKYNIGTNKKRYLWLVVCDCGKLDYRTRAEIYKYKKCSYCIRKEHLKKLAKKHTLKNNQSAKNRLFRRYKYDAKRRNIKFKLNKKEFLKITSQRCYYCGKKPKSKIIEPGGTYYYNGIDRKNNKIGYIKSNTVPCCSKCNIMKRNLIYKDFLEHIEKIYLYHRFNCSHKQYHMLLGRFQVPKPHKGHQLLIETLLKEGKNVLIVLRKEDGTNKNPYTLQQRKKAFKKLYSKEIKEKKVKIVELEDVISVNYGRNPGWEIRQIKVPDNIKSISATKIRDIKGHK